jgi:hypothetical protein
MVHITLSEQFKHMREWCQDQLGKINDPDISTILTYLSKSPNFFEQLRRKNAAKLPRQPMPRIQALAERLVRDKFGSS